MVYRLLVLIISVATCSAYVEKTTDTLADGKAVISYHERYYDCKISASKTGTSEYTATKIPGYGTFTRYYTGFTAQDMFNDLEQGYLKQHLPREEITIKSMLAAMLQSR